MKKRTNLVVRICLIIMIVTSLYLSWKIWTNPANRSFANKNEKNVSDILQEKKITDVYVPTKLFYHSAESDFYYTNKEKTITEINSKLLTLSFKYKQQMDKNSVQKAMYGNNSICLTFPDDIPLSLYKEIYELDFEIPDKMADMKINRLVFSFNDQKVYFINATTNQGISYGVTGNTKSIQNLVNTEDKSNYLSVNLTPENVGNIYYLEDEVKLKTYSYIVATQSFTTFTKAFFNQSDDLYSNDTENVNLSNKEGESLTIQSDTGEVNYFGKLQSSNNDKENKIYYDSFEYVQKLENSMGTLRYFNSKDTDIMFRNYIEGFPVFGTDMKGQLEVGVQDKTVFVRTNQETIQIPIPSDDTVTLIKTQNLINQIQDSGADMSLVTDAQIGYQWQTNYDTKQAADLVPTWYVKYDGSWYSQADLLSKMSEGGTD